MIKGCQKRVVFLKNTGSEFFEEAYFVMCDGDFDRRESDVISEASRILCEAERKSARKTGAILKRENIFSFSLGLVVSALLSVIIAFILK